MPHWCILRAGYTDTTHFETSYMSIFIDPFSQNGRTSSTASSSSRLSPTINSPFNDHQFPYNITKNSKVGRQCSQSNSSSAELNQRINHQKSTSSNDENEENKSELSNQIYVDA
ncbi:unnamed protein product, partial [Rotaria sp. Silwood2]